MVIQMFSVENSSYSSSYNDEGNGGILGRFRLLNGKNEEKEIVLPPQIAREMERILDEAEYSVDSFDAIDVSSSVNQTDGENDFFPDLNYQDHWQDVSLNDKKKFYVFSAYYDDRKKAVIRIIAATKTRTDDQVYCKLWFAHSYPPAVVKAVNKLIRENWNLKYSAYFIMCPLDNNNPVPDAVSVILKHNRDSESILPANRLIVRNHPKFRARSKQSNSNNIAICVKPMHYHYDKLVNLIEFIELNRILGVSHFVLYNHTVGPNVDCLLQQYIDEGVVTVLPWHLNMISQKEIRTEGLFAALNDCLYRTMYRYKYVLMIDFDEYIIPHTKNSLTDMLAELKKSATSKAGAYSFQNSFFYLQWPNDRWANDLRYPLVTLQKTTRKAQFHMHKQRSKCIVIPERVVEMGNHFVWEFVPGNVMVNIDPRLAFLHHYR